MLWKTALTVMMISTQLSAGELEIPKVFINGEVADANDFNLNNDYLIDIIEAEKIRTDELLSNARWKNATAEGAISKKIDCTTNQSALIEAYHASVSDDYLDFLLTGSCFGAYRFVQTVDDEDQPTVYQVQPKNQVVSISSDKTTNPNNRAKLIPRKITADRDYFATGLVSSFGNGLYLTDLEIEMGADDSWGILFSRSSNGGVTDVAIKGNAEPSRRQVGIQIQNGAAAYVGGQNEGKASIESVAAGISMLGQSRANIYGSLIINAQEQGLAAFNGGSFQLSLSSGGKVTGPASVQLNQGGQGWINSSTADVSIDGNIAISSSSLTIGGSTVISDSAIIGLQDSTLNIYNDNSGISSDRITCTGPSFAAVNGLSMNNSNGNGCLDQPGWNVLIDSMLPPSSVSKQPETLSSKMVLEPRSAGETMIGRERGQEPSVGKLPL
ncbi:MAG: hypothetical protein P8N63_08490 [Pseudomonadales bacterium]|nr:hypothetical protein [Pseudomonadales bacterium]